MIKVVFFVCAILWLGGSVYAREFGESDKQECMFTSVPHAVCNISFYKLIARPEIYNGKYVSIAGYLIVHDGRLAIFPSELSYLLSVSQESITISDEISARAEYSRKFGGSIIRLVGKFNYSISGDKPGIGSIDDISNIHKIPLRKPWPDGQDIAGTADEISR